MSVIETPSPDHLDLLSSEHASALALENAFIAARLIGEWIILDPAAKRKAAVIAYSLSKESFHEVTENLSTDECDLLSEEILNLDFVQPPEISLTQKAFTDTLLNPQEAQRLKALTPLHLPSPEEEKEALRLEEEQRLIESGLSRRAAEAKTKKRKKVRPQRPNEMEVLPFGSVDSVKDKVGKRSSIVSIPSPEDAVQPPAVPEISRVRRANLPPALSPLPSSVLKEEKPTPKKEELIPAASSAPEKPAPPVKEKPTPPSPQKSTLPSSDLSVPKAPEVQKESVAPTANAPLSSQPPKGTERVISRTVTRRPLTPSPEPVKPTSHPAVKPDTSPDGATTSEKKTEDLPVAEKSSIQKEESLADRKRREREERERATEERRLERERREMERDAEIRRARAEKEATPAAANALVAPVSLPPEEKPKEEIAPPAEKITEPDKTLDSKDPVGTDPRHRQPKRPKNDPAPIEAPKPAAETPPAPAPTLTPAEAPKSQTLSAPSAEAPKPVPVEAPKPATETPPAPPAEAPKPAPTPPAPAEAPPTQSPPAEAPKPAPTSLTEAPEPALETAPAEAPKPAPNPPAPPIEVPNPPAPIEATLPPQAPAPAAPPVFVPTPIIVSMPAVTPVTPEAPESPQEPPVAPELHTPQSSPPSSYEEPYTAPQRLENLPITPLSHGPSNKAITQLKAAKQALESPVVKGAVSVAQTLVQMAPSAAAEMLRGQDPKTQELVLKIIESGQLEDLTKILNTEIPKAPAPRVIREIPKEEEYYEEPKKRKLFGFLSRSN